MCVNWYCWGFGRENNDKRCLTDNFHVDICCIFPSRVSNHNRVDSLILPFSTLNSEDAVALGGFHMDPTISLCDDLHEDNHESYSIILSKVFLGNLCCTFLKMIVVAGSIMTFKTNTNNNICWFKKKKIQVYQLIFYTAICVVNIC